MSTTQPPHEILAFQGTQPEVEACFSVRVAVFHHEQRFPLDTEFDDKEETATHVLVRLTPSLLPVGTVRGHKVPGTAHYKLSRLAVLAAYRQFRFGRALVLALHDWVREDARRAGRSGAVDVVCHSQIPVKGFYAKLGYEPEGDEFDEDGAPHQKMIARLSLSE